MLLFAAQDVVGESLIWSQRDQALYWVDIVGRRIHGLDPATGNHETWETPDFVTSIGPCSTSGFVVGLRRTVCRWTAGGDFEMLAHPEPDLPGNRLNEGKVAPDGSFWVGTMQDNLADDGSPLPLEHETGAYYRIGAGGDVTPLGPRDFGVTNTMIWTEDGRFITADTTKNELYAYDYDPAGQRLTARRPFGTAFDRGLPDGSCPDTDGGIWNCRVLGGGCVIRYDAAGHVDRIVDLPCSSPTSCAFGGPDLGTLYVTSSRFGMPAEHLATHEHEGGLFALDVGATGLPEHEFSG